MFGAQGESFGVVDERGEIIPAWLIDSQIGSLLENKLCLTTVFRGADILLTE